MKTAKQPEKEQTTSASIQEGPKNAPVGIGLRKDGEFEQKFISRLKNHKSTIEELSAKLKMPKDDIEGYIRMLREKEIQVTATQSKSTGEVFYYINQLPDAHNVYFISGPDKKDRMMDFGYVSDLHFASVFHLPKSFHESMKSLESYGITRVYISGDLLDGTKIYKGHEVNLLRWGVNEQADIAAEAFAMHPTLEFWGIAGNHDYSFTQQNGVKPLAILEKKADNFKNLGDFMADVVYHGIKIRLLHGGGGRAYATSYPSQTYLRDHFRGLEREDLMDVPHVLLLGHYHTFYQGKDHGVMVFQPGSFQDGDNEYCVRRGLTGPAGAFRIQLNYSNAVIKESHVSYIQPAVVAEEKGTAFAKTSISYDRASVKPN